MAFKIPSSETAKLANVQLSTGDWLDDDVERWLTDHPLPANFVWNGERVYPLKTLREGYGQWLRTAGPYHPALRGLFRLCCEILQGLPIGTPMPDGHGLAALLEQSVKPQPMLPGVGEPTANPCATHTEPDENPDSPAF